MIHVAYAIYDKDGRYSKFTGTSMVSLFENTNTPPHSVLIHILHDNTLTPENRDRFNYIAGRYNQQVKFYNVEELCAEKINELKYLMPGVKTTIGTFYRFMITDLLSADIKKIIYLDSDTIINLDINELWQIELGNKVLAAVPEKENDIPITFLPLCMDNLVKHENYFNAGVLVLNLKILRNEKESLQRGIKFIAENSRYVWLDQDILNYLFSDKFIKMPLKFNIFIRNIRLRGDFSITKAIYHYSGDFLRLNMTDPFNRLWFKYFSKTPWFNENTIGNLYGGVQQIYIQQKNFARQISAIISGKTRAFFVSPQNIDAVKQIFYIQPNEEIIAADSPESLQVLINAIQKSKGQKIFFLLLNEYYQVQEILTRAGFTARKDFVNAAEFLSDAEGLPLNSHSLVKIL